jgi:hypothetical protein
MLAVPISRFASRMPLAIAAPSPPRSAQAVRGSDGKMSS